MENLIDAIGVTLFESEKFGGAKVPRGVSPTLRENKTSYGVIEIMADVKVLGSLEAKFESINRIYDVGGVSPTLNTMQGGNREPKILESQTQQRKEQHIDERTERQIGTEKPRYRIRKLTPRECGRLMDVTDEDIIKMEAVNSKSQLYKQFGNSIVVAVMVAMFKNLNIQQNIDTIPLEG